jgi:mono/diheme cytochrome c family protein
MSGLRRSTRRVGLMSALSVAAAVAASVAFAQPPRDDRALYVDFGCYQCHGYEGQGGEALRIAPTVYPFETFAARVRRPPNEMPAYAREVLSDAELEAIYRYVRSRPEPAELPLR